MNKTESTDKIFIYLRLQDEKETLLKSRIREFTALGKLLLDFVRECWELFGQPLLKTGSLEYVDANTDLVLVSFRYDVIRQKLNVGGLIPKSYQKRMLYSEDNKIKLSKDELISKMAANLHPIQKAALQQQIQNPFIDILSLIRENINENGEYNITLDINPI